MARGWQIAVGIVSAGAAVYVVHRLLGASPALASTPFRPIRTPALPVVPSSETPSSASPAIRHSVREWAPRLARLGGDVPLAASLAWLDQESGGNVCSVGDKPPLGQTYPTEYGLSQLDANNPENVAIMNQADARASCQNFGATRADWEKQLRPLTDAERDRHAGKALDHMRSARAHARALTAGWSWDPNGVDMWKMSKLYHAGPAYVQLAATVAKTLGRPPRDFVEYQPLANAAGLRAGRSQAALNKAWTNIANFAKRMMPLWGKDVA